MNNFYLLMLLTALVMFSSCREDVIVEQDPPEEIPVDIPVYRETSIVGIVVDEADLPIPFAEVYSGTEKVAESDAYGLFSIDKILAPENGLYLKVFKVGYFVGGDHFYPVRNEEPPIGEVLITLAEKTNSTKFNSSSGVEFEFEQASVAISANAITKAGAVYQGEVTAYVRYLDPTAVSTSAIMPGDLVALNSEGEQEGLQTFGMIAVELEDENGNELNISSSATLTFPLNSTTLSEAPDEIPLWYFDESKGAWIQEGTALKTGDQYEAKIDHFSWWNCDVPFDATNLCINFITETAGPIEHMNYCIDSPSLGKVRRKILGINQVCGLAPRDELLTISFLDDCGLVFHSVEIGPFTTALSEANVTVLFPDSYELFTVSGVLTDCDGNPVQNGFMNLTYLASTHVDNTLENGAYSIDVLLCDPNETVVELRGVDIVALLEESTTIDLDNSANVYTQDLSVCGDEAAQQFVVTTADSTFTFFACEAIRSNAETLIIAAPDNVTDPSSVEVLLGTKGFETGDFTGNLIFNNTSAGTLSFPEQVDNANVTFTQYEQVGGQISGTFEFGTITGSFVAKRTR